MAYTYPFAEVSEQTKLAVWRTGKQIPDTDGKHWDLTVWRYDICGKPMKYDDHGKTNSEAGWEIDHIKPISQGGSDELSNLQPLQWENNRAKGDNYPWSCP